MKEKDKVQKSIDEIKEWQDHQYDPGYWAGKMPPYLFHKNKKKAMAYCMFGIMWLAVSVISLASGDSYMAAFSFIFALLFSGAGYQNLKK